MLGTLSPDLRDLLGRLLNPDERSRPTLAAVASHAWLGRGLPPPLADRLRTLRAEQARMDAMPPRRYDAARGDAVIADFVGRVPSAKAAAAAKEKQQQARSELPALCCGGRSGACTLQ